MSCCFCHVVKIQKWSNDYLAFLPSQVRGLLEDAGCLEDLTGLLAGKKTESKEVLKNIQDNVTGKVEYGFRRNLLIVFEVNFVI